MVPDSLGGQETVEIMAVLGLLSPLAHRVEHFTLDLDVVVPVCRVMESTKNIVDNLVNRDTRVLPGVEDTTDSNS